MVSSLRKARSTPAGGVEHGVHPVEGHAVGDQGELEVHERHAPHAAAAGEALEVEEVLHRRRALAGQALGVVGVDGGVEAEAHGALQHGVGQEVARGGDAVRPRREQGGVDGLQDALVAPADRVGDLEVDHVPVHVAGLDLRAYLGEPAVVVVETDLDAGLGREGVEVGPGDGLGVRAAPRDDGQRLAGGRRAAGRQRDRRRQRGRRRGEPGGHGESSRGEGHAAPFSRRRRDPADGVRSDAARRAKAMTAVNRRAARVMPRPPRARRRGPGCRSGSSRCGCGRPPAPRRARRRWGS